MANHQACGTTPAGLRRGLAGTAHATVVTGVDIFNGTTPDATFVGSAALQLKTQGCTVSTEGCPLTGVGVVGATAGEIDVNETITGTFTSGQHIDFFQLVLLYEGPEFSDTAEIAQITATLVGGGTLVGRLQTVFDGAGNGVTALWSLGGAAINLSPARDTERALWRVDNPFGAAEIASLEFTAISNLAGDGYTCLPGEGACTNNSDYSIHKVGYSTASVPEPGSLALLAGGLAALAARARRRS